MLLFVFDLVQKVHYLTLLEGKLLTEQKMQYYSDGPDIDSLIITIKPKHLGSTEINISCLCGHPD